MIHRCQSDVRWHACLLILVSSTFAHGQVKPTGAPPRAEGWHMSVIAEGIPHPWAIAWLSDGMPLITARNGTLHTVKEGKFAQVPMDELPGLLVQGQGGLLDIAIHPQKSEKPYVYLTLATGTMEAKRTTLMRGIFDGKRVGKFETLFKVEPDTTGDEHFGSRLLWLPDGTLLMSIGDSGNPPLKVGGVLAREQAQNLGNHLGAILRLNEDGKPASDNPFVGRKGTKPEIWSYGHRNIQGLALDLKTGRVWANEHGPKGGDEINLIEKGKNYGWPMQSFGKDYKTDEPIGKFSVPGVVDPVVVWSPSPAPSGLLVCNSKHYPKWQGSLLSGGLVSKDIRRVTLDEKGNVAHQEALIIGKRVRDVREGPDGFIYVLTDEKNGQLLKIEMK